MWSFSLFFSFWLCWYFNRASIISKEEFFFFWAAESHIWFRVWFFFSSSWSFIFNSHEKCITIIQSQVCWLLLLVRVFCRLFLLCFFGFGWVMRYWQILYHILKILRIFFAVDVSNRYAAERCAYSYDQSH